MDQRNSHQAVESKDSSGFTVVSSRLMCEKCGVKLGQYGTCRLEFMIYWKFFIFWKENERQEFYFVIDT